MPYESLAAWLRDGPPDLTVAAFPDGSRDVRCTVTDAERLATRSAFAARVTERRRGSLSLERERVDPGGQAVNAGRQAAALDAETTIYGHLDDPVFDDIDPETVSMGPPATVYVCAFEDGSVMLVDEETRDGWTLADLRATAPSPLDVDVALCTNWSSFPGLTAALETLAEEGVPAEWVVVDPGDVTARDSESHRALLSALAALDDRTEVVLSANRSEIRTLARSVGADVLGEDEPADRATDAALVERVRMESVATVMHERTRAVAATDGAAVTVPNLHLDEVVRYTGGGDRFTAGLACALAADASLETALALGNACACHYVATGETGDREALAAFVDART